MTSKKKTIGLVAVLLVLAIVGFASWKMTGQSSTSKETAIIVPAGWYLHHTKTGGIILTRQPNLPDVGNTEGLAYGEQIDFEKVNMDKPMEQWIAARIPEGDPLSTSKERGTLNGYTTLKVEHEAEASGKALDYYLFDDGNAYIFSLYPLESTDATGKNAVRNTADIQTLEQIVKDFATKI